MMIRATPAQMIGLSIAMTVGMFGVVFALNVQIYGWPAGLVGAAAVPIAMVAGIRLYRSRTSAAGEGDLHQTEQSNGESDT
jgi:hypothetical protein